MSSNSERIIATTPVVSKNNGGAISNGTATIGSPVQLMRGSEVKVTGLPTNTGGTIAGQNISPQIIKNGEVTVTVDPKTGIPYMNNPMINEKINQENKPISQLTYDSGRISSANIQTKYGVPITSPSGTTSITTCTQTKYGVPILSGGSTSTSTTCTQTKYGVPISNGESTSTSTTCTQTKYGVPIPAGTGYSQTGTFANGDINVSFDQLESNISLLKETISSLRSSWDDGVKKNLDDINNSWVGADCEAYLAKLSKMDNKVHGTVKALELLCNAYERTRDILKDNQADLVSTIDNIN